MNDHEQEYDLEAIRQLLRDSFTGPELRRLCISSKTFREIGITFTSGQGLDQMIDALLDFCRTRLLFGELLLTVKTANPKQFERYEASHPVVKALPPASPAAVSGVQKHPSLWSHVAAATLSFLLGVASTFLVYTYVLKAPLHIESTSNILSNGDFEQSVYENIWGWSESAEVKWDEGYSGKGLCITQKATQEQGASDWAFLYQTIKVTPSQSYRFEARMKWINAFQAHLKVDWSNANGDSLDWDLLSDWVDGNSGGWTLQNQTVAAPANATYANIVAIHGVADDGTNVPGGMLCVDEVIFEPSGTP